MTRVLLSLLVMFCLCINAIRTNAQCNAPVSISAVVVSHETCPGNAVIALQSINPVASALVAPQEYYEFQLLKSSDSAVVKNWQQSDTFRGGIVNGSYIVRARIKCMTGFSDIVWDNATVNVLDELNFANITSVTILEKAYSNCCGGKARINATGNAPLSYALVDGFLASSNIIRPRQSSNEFDNLCADTFYVRVWDACEGFNTYQFTVDANNTNVSISDITFKKYDCDSFTVEYNIYNIYNRPNTTDTSKVRNWVIWPNGETDTIDIRDYPGAFNESFTVPFGLYQFNSSFNPNVGFPSNIGSGPKTFTFGYSDVCGKITTETRTIEPSPLTYRYDSATAGCSDIYYTFHLFYNPLFGNYPAFQDSNTYINENVFYSLDNGSTWTAATSGGYSNQIGPVLLPMNTTYDVKLAFCNDTISFNFTTGELEGLTNGIISAPDTMINCTGTIIINADSTNMISSELTVELVWSDPPFTPMPAPIQVPRGTSLYYSDLPFGRYAVRVTDSAGLISSCLRSYIDTITLAPSPLNIEMRPESYNACINYGTLVIFNHANTGANGRALTVLVLDQPSGGNVPSNFLWTLPTSNVDQPVYNNNLQSIIPGNYTFVFIDSAGLDANCRRFDTVTVSFGMRYDNRIVVNNECNGDLLIRRNYDALYNSFGYYSIPELPDYITQIHNSSNVLMIELTGQRGPNWIVDIDFVVPEDTLEQWPDGIYYIRTFNKGMQQYNLGYDTDSCTSAHATWTKYSGKVDPSASIYVNGCDADSADAMIIGIGRGNYKAPLEWTLYETAIDPQNLIAGPQLDNVFDNLVANQTYVIQASDQCGVSQNYVTSISTTLRLFATNSTNEACPGETVTFYVEPIPGALYQWYKDNTAIPGETSNALILTDISELDDAGEYKVEVDLFSECALSSNVFDLQVDCEPLNLTISDFVVYQKNRTAQLEWHTNQDSNLKGFTIERSKTGANWHAIGFVNSQNKNDVKHSNFSYQFTDNEPYLGRNFYRIQQVYYSEQQTYSPVRSLWFTDSKTNFVLYPNPANNILNINGITGNETISIYDVMGRTILHTTATSIINIEQFQNGTYRVVIQRDNDMISLPLVIMKK